jgi:GNAT superfamily N-acetyltransferase
MEPVFHPAAGWDEDDLDVHLLDGPPPQGFDCGRDEQNQFLYARAWPDQHRRLSVTRLFFVKGIFAAFVTTLADAIELGTREKDEGVRYPTLAAIKIAQLAVDRRFAGGGLGRALVAYVIEYVRQASAGIGCRYVTVDARPELEAWYAAQGFVRNKLVTRRKLEHARAIGRDETDVPISMRYDLLESV